ncbi:MAG: DUF5939 domain-containing protein, partial [Termitinemataceae bacterium]
MPEFQKRFLDALPFAGIAKELYHFIESASESELFHIDVYRLADTWNIPRRDMLEVFLTGVKAGLFDLSWEFHCPHCGGVAKESVRLKEVHSEDYCPMCRVDFRNVLDQNVEVFFSINESIRTIPSSMKSAYFDTDGFNRSRLAGVFGALYSVYCVSHRQ